jgi:glutathione synthase/RimK-type ligase-like ATP-grasp enzyme
MPKYDKQNLKHVIITENPELIQNNAPESLIIISPEVYISDDKQDVVPDFDLQKDSKLRVINLCNSYEYLSKGYYCSLMAEARGQRCIPPVDNVITMNWKRLSRETIAELNGLLARNYKEPLEIQIAKTFLFVFGRSEDPKLEFLSRRLFDAMRFPILEVEIRYNGDNWVVGEIKPMGLKALPKLKMGLFEQALGAYTGKAWSSSRKPTQEKFWLGILHNPKEEMAPSNKGALENFLRVAKKHNVFADLITKEDLPSLLEYEALFIRETTQIDHHTYRFAYKAEMEGIPVLDDTASILRCSNKVFLHEVMTSKNIPVPETQLIDLKTARKLEKEIEFPVILKVPDGSFSKGMAKAMNITEYREAVQNFFKRSDLLLLQEYLPSEYDWRIGVLDGKPLFACRYYMAEGHWQIYNHGAKRKKKQTGKHETIAISAVPKKVMSVALKAAKLIGNGLYGVDLKENERGVFVIEVNDNPSIDKGVEDSVEGDKLYSRIIEHFEQMVNG